MNTTLQVPIQKELRDQAMAVSERLGFSSLQETVRVFLTQLASERLDISFSSPVHLSEKNKKKYDKMIHDVVRGKVKTRKFTDVTELLDTLPM